VPPKIVRNTAASDAADFGCNLLDNNHERETEKKGPREPKAKLCADLTMRADPTGIVVCRSGYEART